MSIWDFIKYSLIKPIHIYAYLDKEIYLNDIMYPLPSCFQRKQTWSCSFPISGNEHLLINL